MQTIADARGFASELLVGPRATADRIIGAIKSAACKLPEESLFLLTFAGHGMQKKSIGEECGNGELFGKDQAWAAADRALLDDELRRICWPEFKAGTRVFLIVDACHSGSFIDYQFANLFQYLGAKRYTGGIPPFFARRMFDLNSDMYKKIIDELPPCRAISAKVHSIAACDDVTKAPYPIGFTNVISSVWKDGAFVGTYGSFKTAVIAEAKRRGNLPKPFECCAEDPDFWAADAFELVRP